MKKYVIFALFTMFGVSAFAQKGMIGVGLNLNYTPCLESGVDLNNFGVSGKFQYGITDAIRGEINVGYDFKDSGISLFEAGGSLHYLFNVTDKLKLYPIVGVGYANVNFDFDDMFDWDDDDWDYSKPRKKEYYYDDDDDDYDDSTSDDKVYVNAGLGTEYDISNNFSLNLEVKYQYIKDFNRLPVSLGFTYRF